MSKVKPVVEQVDWMTRRRRRAAFRSLERLVALSEVLKQERNSDASDDKRVSAERPDSPESSRYRSAQQMQWLRTGC